MLLRLSRQIAPAELRAVEAVAEELGYALTRLGERGDVAELARLPGSRPPAGPAHVAAFADLSGVVEILDRGDVRELWRARPDGAASTVVEAAGARFGGGSASIIAGPCAVEDEARLLEVAQAVRSRGASLLRGGAFKPRTSPYSFQGLGREGLEMLRNVREATGLGIVTEVLDPRDVEAVADAADLVQVGARSMANYALLKELGELRQPVLLKRGFGATVSEFLGAAEYVLAGGNESVVLCERGVRGFDRVTRNLLDVGAIAHLAGATHLPVITDPSHAAGRADLVRAIGRAGLIAGADGLMVEVHPAPAEVHSDGQQAIGLDEFGALVRDAEALCVLDDRRLVTLDETPDGASSRPSMSPLPTAHLRGTA
ncbi:MAG: 3-deoxy-7-phosphoheptulonate synthase [Planctomycetota bacterium]